MKRTVMSYLSLLVMMIVSMSVSAADWTSFELKLNAEGLLTAEEVTSKTDVEFGVALDANGAAVRVAKDDASSIATVSGKYHSDHGMNPFKMVLPVDSKVTITAGTCSYGTTQIMVNGSAISEAATGDGSTMCWKNNPANVVVGKYNGEPATLTITTGSYLPYIKVEKIGDVEIKEKKIYTTRFNNWDALSSSTKESKVTVTTVANQDVDFLLSETQAAPDGTNAKFTAECITTGYLMAAKSATPYIKTSKIADVTTVKYVHAATDSNRGWGLKVKGDGDADWVTVSDAAANPASGQEVTVNVNRKNVELWFYNLNSAQNAYMTSLEINGNVEVPARKFKDFKVDFRSDPYTVVTPSTGLPEDVTIEGGSFHGNQHGIQGNAVVTVPVDGPVKFTIGGCQYTSNNAKVSIDGGEAEEIDVKSAGCDNAGVGSKYEKFATYTYNVEKAAVLKFTLADYCPYFIAEQCDFVPSVEVSYFNIDGKLIGQETVAGNSKLAYKYGEADVTVPEGQKFRGWFSDNSVKAVKVAEGMALTEDIKLYAKATEIEVAEVGKMYSYELNKNNFYIEDHELISAVSGSFHDATHGWSFGNNGSLSIDVAGNAVVNFSLCQYSNAEGTIVCTDAAGNTVGEPIAVKVDDGTDGSTASVAYSGSATTLTFTMNKGGYIHNLTVYNVDEVPEKDAETGYYILKGGDGASLQLILAVAKNGDKVFLPNGTYDFGSTCLTGVPAGVSIIGQNQEKTIIKNTPLEEGIGVTATLMPGGNNYMQDLSIQCSSEKCATPAASRCVAIQDKTTRNIFKNVSLLSGQDTYYSNGKDSQQSYFENCRIEGTVDYICGGGDIVFKNTTFYNKSRSSDIIFAPATASTTKWGYVALDCIVDGDAGMDGKFDIGRDWQKSPAATLINTEFKKIPTADGYTNMSSTALELRFHEFNSHKSDGTVITGHNLDKLVGGSNYTPALYLTEDQAAAYTLEKIFAAGQYAGVEAWNPTEATEQAVADADNIDAQGIYLVEDNGEFVAIVKGTDVNTYVGKTIRKANAVGGFGAPVELQQKTAIEVVEVNKPKVVNGPVFGVDGCRYGAPQRGRLNITADGVKFAM